MKVSGSGASGAVSGARSGGRSGAADGFAPIGAGQAQGPAVTARAGPASGVSSLDALMALQEAGGPMERRKKAMTRAGRLLDVLDDLKLDLLDGATSPEAMQRLRRLVAEQRAGTDDSGLEGLLDQIDTRAAVELAKQEMARTGIA